MRDVVIMDKKIFDSYVKAGVIASEIKKEIIPDIFVDAKLLDIAEKIENMIRDNGGEPAFPVNLSLNEIAAHYTPIKNDPIVIKEKDILKIDLGVHIDGFVCDTAMTVCFDSDMNDLVKASKLAAEEALKLCIPGTEIKDISDVIEETITSFGYKPIANLTGHGLDKFNLHTEPQVPNVKNDINIELEENMVIAVEPFATTGQGLVKDSGTPMIFSMLRRLPVRNMDGRKIIEFSEKNNNLPFAERWLPIDSRVKIKLAMTELIQKGIMHEYPPLKEVNNGLVSQTEHTVIIRDKPVITSI